MKELKDIYDRITFLRHKGVKMKDIAKQTGVAPSVLSALYTTVFPAYFKNIGKQMDEASALDEALIWVNNVSKKKLLSTVAEMKTALWNMDVETSRQTAATGNPYLARLDKAMQLTAKNITNVSGIYMSYSLSSNSAAMKLEPYLIAPAEEGTHVDVVHNSAYGTTHEGFALLNGSNHLYMVFNESRAPQLDLFNICLKLPMYDRPPLIRGVYTCFDYNYNPVARRILFIKRSDSTAREDFIGEKGCLKTIDELDDEERAYYNYTCGREDIIRLCNIPSPRMTAEDLSVEKRLLNYDNRNRPEASPETGRETHNIDKESQ